MKEQQFEESKIQEPEQKSAPETGRKRMLKDILEWFFCIVLAVSVAFAIRGFVFTMIRVEGDSMLPTLQSNDRMVLWKLGYHPEKGDIIVLHQENHPPYIKRVIATEGQEVNIDFVRHKVYVDGVEQTEPFILQPTAERGDVKFPVVVPEDCVFVMGDNRNNSRDSRFSSVGMVQEEDITGKAVLRVYPFDKFGKVE